MVIVLGVADADLEVMLTFLLRRDGHEVRVARDAAGVQRLVSQPQAALVLLVDSLPDMLAPALCAAVTQQADLPMIVLSPQRGETESVAALDAGAAVVLPLPFSPRLLRAYIHALLRWRTPLNYRPLRGPVLSDLTVGDLTLRPQRRQVVHPAGTATLTSTEFQLLRELVVHEGQVLAAAQLADRVWGFSGNENANNLVKGHIRNLRHKLGDPSARPIYIHTLRGAGYCFRRRTAGHP